MRNQHLELHNPNMHGSKDVGVYIQSVTEGQKGGQNNNAPLYLKCRGGGKRWIKNEETFEILTNSAISESSGLATFILLENIKFLYVKTVDVCIRMYFLNYSK